MCSTGECSDCQGLRELDGPAYLPFFANPNPRRETMDATEIVDTKLEPAIRHAGHQMTEADALAKMNAYIEENRAAATGTLNSIMTVVPQDRVIPAPALNFQVTDGTLAFNAPTGTGGYKAETFHRNALTQLAGRLEIPVAYVDHLVGAQAPGGEGQAPDLWGLRFLAETFQRHADHSADRYLVRSVEGQARAFLSDKFRRIDCRPGALQLIEVARAAGFVISSGTFTDTRSAIKFIWPRAIEVFPGEWMVFGFEWSNSDYGRGASDLRMFFWRAWCWNGATGESVVRQVHIGKRLSDDIAYAQDTLDADAQASALALRDAAADAMSDRRRTRMVEGIRAANATKIDPKGRAESLKKVLTKAEAESVVQAFNSPDVENMPAGNTLWRWSNAISWVGGQTADADRKLDFERLAGEVIKPAMAKEAA